MKQLVAPLVFVLAFACLEGLQAAPVKLGNEVLAESGFKALQGKRVGLLTNPSGVNRNLDTTIEVLRQAPGVKLVSLLAPEHGVYGDVPAGDKVETRTDARTGLTVHSLYPKHKPTSAMLQGLDAVAYDLQDTGCRSYTFITTMGEAMEACGEAGIEFVVLDRPNPLGGVRVEGVGVEDKFRSAVSRWDVAYVYGMTCGELARMINGEGWIKKPCKLTVIPLKGWKRTMTWRDTGLPWVPTSPHVPHGESPLFQVATGMTGELSGKAVSTGIGYTLPFQCLAAPGVDMHKLAETLNAYALPGVRFQPITYKPYYFGFEATNVSGVQIFFTDPATAPLTAINFYGLEALKKVTGRDIFQESVKANRGFAMFDKVNGTDATRKALQEGKTAAEIVTSWKPAEDAFRKKREKYLLY
jgi:uncharacterized protein YbbC (DUF1343 family)